jgi:DNA mismatch endonuclease (patch repair protein)
LPGKPDVVFAKHRVCLFFNGCFWHGHSCSLFKTPKTRTTFWVEKIAHNRLRDKAAINLLIESGWRVLVVWECAIRGPNRQTLSDVIDHCAKIIAGSQTTRFFQVAG